ncbi:MULTISPECIES: hypothetical protein [unclassified Butyrivibrio]|uniref:hypothetical protein n=1 Tax=unclassified Butyrivibrio TaxID=2639466 RepID=UPI00040A7F59|nr:MULTISPECIES: hypothetical protein [unclassified Butyrivibrio]
MKKIEYSKVVQRKLKALKEELTEKYGGETSVDTMTKIMRDIHHLSDNDRIGIQISQMYDVDTDYWYLFTSHNYFIYRTEKTSVVIVNMFNEKEDFMLKLFGISGRTQESIDYWGE